jgi:hypothetical protein
MQQLRVQTTFLPSFGASHHLCLHGHAILHFISTLNNCSNVINQTLLRPLDIQLTFPDLEPRFLNLFLIRMNIMRFL